MLFWLFLFFYSPLLSESLDPGEVQALLDMQTEWGQQLGWNGYPSCSWPGITCDANEHIFSVGLNNKTLSGTIPSSLGNLIYANAIELASNQLAGSIPSSIGNLLPLQYFYLASNGLSGNIPDSIGNLNRLINLWWNDNRLTGTIPQTMGNLKSAENIWLENNQLSGTIPETIGRLLVLRTMYVALGGNYFFSGLLTFYHQKSVQQFPFWIDS